MAEYTGAGDKGELRRSVLKRRAAVAPEARDAFSARLAALGPRLVLEAAPSGGGSLVVSLFSTIGSEPDMAPLAGALHAAGVPLALPVAWSHGAALEFRRWMPGDPLAPGPLGIPEPLADAPSVDPDVLFVPLAVFDRRGHRVGYGAGHYDRSLAALRGQKRITAIGVAYALQEALFVPDEPHDEPLDMVVTDRDIILCRD